jgi:hypothetical protein
VVAASEFDRLVRDGSAFKEHGDHGRRNLARFLLSCKL